jgi:hypothetical protein
LSWFNDPDQNHRARRGARRQDRENEGDTQPFLATPAPELISRSSVGPTRSGDDDGELRMYGKVQIE